MRLIQLTTNGAAQQISPANPTGPQVYCSLLIIQNNGTGNIRVGDNTVSATKGIILTPSGSITANPFMVRGTMLAQWYTYGAASNTVDILYETSN